MAATRHRKVEPKIQGQTKMPLPLRTISDGCIIVEIYKNKAEDPNPDCTWFKYIYSPHKGSKMVGFEMPWPEEQVLSYFSFKRLVHVTRDELKQLNLLDDGKSDIPDQKENPDDTKRAGSQPLLF